MIQCERVNLRDRIKTPVYVMRLIESESAASHLLVQVTQVVVVGVASTAWILIGAAGVRWPLHLCHLQTDMSQGSLPHLLHTPPLPCILRRI